MTDSIIKTDINELYSSFWDLLRNIDVYIPMNSRLWIANSSLMVIERKNRWWTRQDGVRIDFVPACQLGDMVKT